MKKKAAQFTADRLLLPARKDVVDSMEGGARSEAHQLPSVPLGQGIACTVRGRARLAGAVKVPAQLTPWGGGLKRALRDTSR
jgi:hypothetical protein